MEAEPEGAASKGWERGPHAALWGQRWLWNEPLPGPADLIACSLPSETAGGHLLPANHPAGSSCISGGGCVWWAVETWQVGMVTAETWERGQPAGLWAGSGGSCGEDSVVCCALASDDPLYRCQESHSYPSRTILTSVLVQVWSGAGRRPGEAEALIQRQWGGGAGSLAF